MPPPFYGLLFSIGIVGIIGFTNFTNFANARLVTRFGYY